MTKKCHVWIFTLWVSAGLLGTAYGQTAEVGDYDLTAKFSTPHPYPGSPSGKEALVWMDTYQYPGANYVVFHFSRFDLAPGDFIIVRDPEETVKHIYRDQGFLNKGSFYTLSVAGDTAMIELYSKDRSPTAFGYEVDYVARGYSDEELDARNDGGPALRVCGPTDWKEAICYEKDYPIEYQRSRAAAKLLRSGRTLCTTWLLSCENHMLTNNHCFSSQSVLDNVEVQFMYQTPTCGSGSAQPALQLQGGQLLRTSRNFDYTLYIPNLDGQDPQAMFGFLQIDQNTPTVGDPMYIVGHPRGVPKKISLESTHPADKGGRCLVQTLNVGRCVGNVSEIGYFCDTDGGSSGSPVLSAVSHKAIAIHNCGTCPNRGMPITAVYNDIQNSDTPLPACSTEDP